MDTVALTRMLISHYGNEEALAALAGVGQSSVNRWANGGNIRGNHLLRLMELARSVPSAASIIADVTDVASHNEGFTPTVVPGRELVGEKNLPVFAAAMGGEGHQIVTFDAIDYVKRPSILENVKDAYGVYIVGESMTPAFEPGDMALVHPHLPPARDKNVVLYHVPPFGHGEAEAIVKRLVRWSDRDWHLKQYNPSIEFTESRADWKWCHRIVGKYEAR
ncbi:S24 family peptidase [Rhizobium sp. P007]|uniref:S24 family peptidase n=1 Tax=Rhizobium sp. P007 TaxID=285908 RepID=UPI001156CB4C|nr:S24 family peptidase [Rhizobium sp. P007]CAD7025102.1 helix-turn-helix transcriptional regulator [Rhizobium sp. P007]